MKVVTLMCVGHMHVSSVCLWLCVCEREKERERERERMWVFSKLNLSLFVCIYSPTRLAETPVQV